MLKSLKQLWYFFDPASQGSAYTPRLKARNQAKVSIFAYRMKNRWAIK